MDPLMMTLVLLVALSVFCRTMIRRIELLKALQPAERFDRIKERLWNVVVFAFGQKRLIGRKRERSSGWMHAFIFWGFCVLLIRSVQLYGEGFSEGFHLPFLGGRYFAGFVYAGMKDVMEGIVLAMVIWAIYRRAFVGIRRLHNSFEAYLVLCLIGVLMVSDLLLDASRYHLIHLHKADLLYLRHPLYGTEFTWTPVAVSASFLIRSLDAASAAVLMKTMFWVHVCGQLIFLNILPIGKHFHVITSLPNVFFKSLDEPHDKPRLLDLEDADAWENETLGLNHIHQLTWKQGLDLYTCTECGRCKDVCPTYTTQKPLNLFDFNDTLKHALYENEKRILRRSQLERRLRQAKDPEDIEFLKGELAASRSPKSLVGDVVSEDTLWACTTCRACEEVCPVTIEHVPRIIAMRQGQYLIRESYPQELNPALKGLEYNGNPWGIGYDKRADWAEGLGVKTLAEDPDADILFWVGCAGSFDDRSKKVSVSLVKILQKAGVRFAILGTEEKCTGDFARRVGNEMLFQMMAQENIATLNGYGVKRIVTACPHCLNTLKQEYPQLGGRYDVVHHSTFIHTLIRQKRIQPKGMWERPLSYHDPCYLGRYNQVYKAPRDILGKVAKGGFIELERFGAESFCCGAGGGRMWMEENIGKRINVERSEEIVRSMVATVAVGCPFCMTMIEDGMKQLGKEEDVRVKDIAEIVASCI